MTKSRTRQCKVCQEIKSLSYANFPRHGAGQLQTCRSCWEARKLSAATPPAEEPIFSVAHATERNDALVFAISKLITLQNTVTTYFTEREQVTQQLRQKEVELAAVREELELAKLEIEELQEKLQKANTKTALVGLTPAERATLADFGYRPAVV